MHVFKIIKLANLHLFKVKKEKKLMNFVPRFQSVSSYTCKANDESWKSSGKK